MSIKSDILLRTRLAFLACVFVGIAILVKIMIIQTTEGEYWTKKAAQVSLKRMQINATRGNIYSDNGSLLATSLPFYKLYIDPTIPKKQVLLKNLDSLCLLLSAYFKDMTATEYKRKILDARAQGKEYVLLSNKLIGYMDKKRITKWPVFREGRYKGGAIFEKIEKRYHPFGDLLAMRTIGFVNENKEGAGLEYSFNNLLGGRDGEALFRKLAGGNWKPIHDDTEILPEQGLDIETTIDVNLQDLAESSLEYHLTKHDASYGCVILMEVKTGEIKALANLGKTKQGDYRELYNYAVAEQGLTDPGSTFKLASLMALFEETNISLDDTINCENGSYRIYDRILKDAKPDGYGTLTVRDVFAKSSNIGVAKLILSTFGKNPNKYLNYLSEFGLDKKTNFQMMGEAQPYIKTTKDKYWSGISLPWMSIGYELKVAPLHILTFYNAVANHGKMIKPIIVKKVKSADNTLQTFETEVLNKKICSDKTLQKCLDMMEEVVVSGTAKNIFNKEYSIAGKTGTAQIIKSGGYTKNYYTSFCGFFPAKNPKYSCIVVISEPQGFNQMAGDVSAPVFKELADKIYSLDFEMHNAIQESKEMYTIDFPVIRSGKMADLEYLCNEFGISNHASTQQDWVRAEVVNNAIIWKGKSITSGLMPDVIGMTLRDALPILENKGIQVRYSGMGRVLHQSINPGIRITKGSTVYLELS